MYFGGYKLSENKHRVWSDAMKSSWWPKSPGGLGNLRPQFH